MTYTEKVGLNSTALSILLYECINSVNSQEGFLIGNITSQISNHISDSHNDTARLDTKIEITNVLPLPAVSMFYLPTGMLREDVLTELLSSYASDVVGWYKYRKNNCLKPTFRDKLICRTLQKHFEKYHGKKQFVFCKLTNKISPGASTHTLSYRFGKINCFDVYENLEDETANLGGKVSGYKPSCRLPESSAFLKVIKQSNIQNNTTNDAILRVQDVINLKLQEQARIAAIDESAIRELEAEVRQMVAILADKQAMDLQIANDKLIEQKFSNCDTEMAEACLKAMKKPTSVDMLNIPSVVINSNNVTHNIMLTQSNAVERTTFDVNLPSTSSGKQTQQNCTNTHKNTTGTPSTSSNNCADLITFDVDDVQAQKPTYFNDNIKSISDSSPEC